MSNASAITWPGEPAIAGIRPRSRLRTSAGKRFMWAAVAAAGLSLLFIAWVGLQIGGPTVTRAFDDIGEAVAALIGAVSCGYAAVRAGGRMRVAWAFLGASAFLWFLGEVVWSVYEVALGQAIPFPSAADAGFLLAIPLAVVAVLAFPSAPGRGTTRSQALVDGTIVALSLVFVGWALGLGKVYASSSDKPLAQLIGAAYPAGDIVVLTVLLMAVRRAPVQQRGSMFLLMGGLAANAVADSAFAYLNAAGTYTSLGSALDAGWVVGYLLIALAPLWPAPFTGTVGEEGPVDLWQMSLPWVSLFGAATVAMVLAITGHGLDVFLTAIGGGLSMLLVASMVLMHRDAGALLKFRERAEVHLQQRTEMLNQVITHAPLGVARVGVDLRILDANPRLGSLLHAPAKIMVGSLVGDYLSSEGMADLLERSRPLWEGQVDTIEGNTPTRRADGSEAWLHYSVTAVRKPNGRIDYFLAMFEDVTSKHAAEEAAVANLEGLERLNKLKSEFVSMVSHEFRTALVGIQGFSEILRDDTMGADEVKSLASDINQEAERLNRMSGEMLDLDRMEAGKIRLDPQPLDVNTLVRGAVERAQMSTETHPIRTELDPSLPIVNADSDRLVQVVSNLLTNAVKYSPDGGEITVSTRAEDGVVRVSVRDHGMGIAPEFVDRLFGRYERFESNRTSKVVGTGLGLAISRQIVELHGGRIWVESKVGEGSDFQFTIPVSAATA